MMQAQPQIAMRRIRQLPSIGDGLMITLIGMGWAGILWLWLDMAARGLATKTGLGSSLFSNLPPYAVSDFLGQPYRFSLCVTDSPNWALFDFGKALFMWAAMIGAMMLPTLIRARKSRYTTAFISGYLLIWLGICLVGVVLQWILRQHGWMSPNMVLINPQIAAAILFSIGLFQLSPHKQVRLQSCNQVMDTSTRWSDGIRAGQHCVLCCAPLMMSMFVLGLMNILAIAGLALLMWAERHYSRLAPLSGVALILLALTYLF